MFRQPLPVTLALTLAFAPLVACKDKDKAEGEETPAATFEPGAKTESTLASLGGATISAPDNLKINEADGEATLEAEGFPTTTITYAEGDNNGTGTSAKTSMGKVTVEVMTPTATWTCEADKVGDHKDLVIEICESITAAKDPKVSDMTCKTVTGFDTEPVTAAWTALADRFKACFEPLDETGVSFGFNFKLEGTSQNFTKYSSPQVKDEAASTCLKAIYDELRDSEAFKKDGLEAGQIECDGSYSQF